MSIRKFLAKIKLQQMKNRLEPVSFEFPLALKQPHKVLVCLPRGLRELTLVKQFLPTITELFRPAEVTLLSMPGIKVHDIYPRKGFHILSPSAEQLTWFGLPKKSYLKLLQDEKFDLVIDLNLEQSTFTSGILLSFPKALRVGRGNHLGEPFYNLEIKTKYLRDERNIYRSLFEMLATLKNSRN